MKKIILFCVMLSMLLGLAVWQVFRLQNKNQIIKNIQENRGVIDIYHASQLSSSKYKNVRATGFLVPKKIFYYRLVDNKPGYETLLPFIMEDKSIILVSLGWSEEKVGCNVTMTKQEVEGRLMGWYTGNIIDPDNNLIKNEWFSLNKREIEKYTGLQVKPYLILLSKPEDLLSGRKIPFDVRNIPNKHLEYAITWFSLALALTVIFIIDFRRKGK